MSDLPRPSCLAHFRFSQLNPVVHSAKFSALPSVDDDQRTFLIDSLREYRAIFVHYECVGDAAAVHFRLVGRHRNFPLSDPDDGSARQCCSLSQFLTETQPNGSTLPAGRGAAPQLCIACGIMCCRKGRLRINRMTCSRANGQAPVAT